MIRAPGLLFPEKVLHPVYPEGQWFTCTHILVEDIVQQGAVGCLVCGPVMRLLPADSNELRVYNNPCTLKEMEMNIQKEILVIHEMNSRKRKKMNCQRCAQLWLNREGGNLQHLLMEQGVSHHTKLQGSS